MNRILIIEDDPDIALSLRYCLENEGDFSVEVAHDGELGLRQARKSRPDLLLLDLALPGMDGTAICRRLRQDEDTAAMPVIMLTARVEEADKLHGLSLGADDYITKPFSMKEVVARVRAVLRRSRTPAAEPEVLSCCGIEVDRSRRTVQVGDRMLELTRKEFDLLADLMSRPGRVATREQLLERVWGYEHPGNTRTVDVHVRQLRKKLGSPADGCIETMVGVGYRFRGED
jgi:two-component system alkaline phosphatase synthesis response regulator PhoP